MASLTEIPAASKNKSVSTTEEGWRSYRKRSIGEDDASRKSPRTKQTVRNPRRAETEPKKKNKGPLVSRHKVPRASPARLLARPRRRPPAVAANRSRTQLERSPLVNTTSTSLGLGLVGDEISAVHSWDSTRGSAGRANLVSPDSGPRPITEAHRNPISPFLLALERKKSTMTPLKIG